MSDVFLSYSRRDSQIMGKIRDALQNAGLNIWTDENLEPGTPSWKRAIQSAIEDAKCIVVILSPDSKGSHWVMEELDYASTHGLDIFPILALGDEKTSVPFGLSTSQWIDIRDTRNFDNEVSRLQAALAKKLRVSSSGAKAEAKAAINLPTAWPARYYKRLEFWEGLLEKSNRKTNLFQSISGSKHATISKSIRRGIKLDYRINLNSATVRLYIDVGSRDENLRIFDMLFQERDKIERELSSPLSWDANKDERACTISKTMHSGGLATPEKWPKIQDEMVEEMVWLHHVLGPYIDRVSPR